MGAGVTIELCARLIIISGDYFLILKINDVKSSLFRKVIQYSLLKRQTMSEDERVKQREQLIQYILAPQVL